MSYIARFVTEPRRIRCVCPTCKTPHHHRGRVTLARIEFPSAYARIYRRAGWDPSDYHRPTIKALDALPTLEYALNSISSMPRLYADLFPAPESSLCPLKAIRSLCMKHPDSTLHVKC